MKTLARPGDRAAILERLARVTPGSHRRWGRMSAHQMVCHLGDGFRMALGARAVRPAAGRLAGLALKGVALYLPVRWPPGIRTMPELDQVVGGTCPGEFGRDLADVIAMVESLAVDGGPACAAHPVFGAMSRRQWLRWGYLHIDHHLRQFGL